MIAIKLKNCNNISECEFKIEKNTLNIFYAMNGTGKSTIAKALQNSDDIKHLKPFSKDAIPSIEISEAFNKVMTFDEEFINSIVFQESQVINNAFNVFIKSEKYDKMLEEIHAKLQRLKFDTSDEDFNTLYQTSKNVLQKLKLTKTK